MQDALTGYAGTRYVIHNTRAHPYIPYAAEKTLSRSLGGRRGLDKTVRRLQGYPASRERDWRQLFYTGDAREIESPISEREREREVLFSPIAKNKK